MRKASSSHTMFHFLRSSFVQCQVKCGLQGGQGSRGANFKRGWRVSGSSTLPVQAFFSLMLPRDVFSLRTTLAENTEIAWLDYHTCCWSAYANAMQIWNVSNNHSCTTRTVGICQRFQQHGNFVGLAGDKMIDLGNAGDFFKHELGAKVPFHCMTFQSMWFSSFAHRTLSRLFLKPSHQTSVASLAWFFKQS